jgi:CRISPR-associated protein Csd1
MIINALNRYYEILVEDDKSDIPSEGYSSTNVSAALIISSEGELQDVMCLKLESKDGKKLIPRNMIVPKQFKRSGSAAPAYFMCDNVQYVLGFDKNKNIKVKQYLDFKQKHNKILDGASGECAKAILKFINSWDINKALNNPLISNNLDSLCDKNIVFRIEGAFEFAHKDIEIKKMWEKSQFDADDLRISQCLITGEELDIERIHNSIKPLYMPKGKQPSPNGWTLVAVDKDSTAFDSYNKKQGFNSPVSRKVAFAYTTVLNHMLKNLKQKIQIGDATTVFWGESPDSIYSDLAMQLFEPAINEETDTVIDDVKIQRLISELLKNAKRGYQVPIDINNEVNPLTKFYILGLSPNASRVSVRFFHQDTFCGFVTKLSWHYRDLEIIKEKESDRDNIPLRWLVNETVSPQSKVKDPAPLLGGALMRSILGGGLYPQSLYNSILSRVKSDADVRVNYLRASIIKAYLSRKGRITKNKLLEEVVTVALNEQTTEKSYLLGRLFAILEKTQIDAGNETIRARYFTSAMTTPGATFPILLRLAQHHIAKFKFGFVNDKKIEGILNEVEGFPAHLNLDEQGLFTLGYYQQRVKLWEKKAKEIHNSEEEK